MTNPKPRLPSRMALRLAALLLAHEGVVPNADAIEFAERHRTGSRSCARMVADAMRPLAHEGVVVRHEDTWYVPNLADLGAWLADGLEAWEDAGMANDPVLPPGARPAIPRQGGERRPVAA